MNGFCFALLLFLAQLTDRAALSWLLSETCAHATRAPWQEKILNPLNPSPPRAGRSESQPPRSRQTQAVDVTPEVLVSVWLIRR